MTRHSRLLLALLVALLLVVPGCRKEKTDEDDAFSFVVYPGARYLPHLTEVTKQAHKVIEPNKEPAPVAIYDTDASVDDVAQFYVKSYGYNGIAADASNDLSAAKPPAYRRTGDLQADTKGIEPLLPKLNLKTDVAKAIGTYKAIEIAPKTNRPRVTVQRPYFDVTTSQTVDRTIILMSR